jgi:isopentenyl-diphosphate delta-isomerase
VSTGEEQVVLLDADLQPCGVLAKSEVHHENTPLHLAFSVYVFDADGRLLVTRRAVGKQTFPGVWTNTCCGHPAPDEELAVAVRRRLDTELGLAVSELALVLPACRGGGVALGGLGGVLRGRGVGAVGGQPVVGRAGPATAGGAGRQAVIR